MENLPKVIIGESHRLVAEAIKGLILPHFEVCRIVNDGPLLVEQALQLKPDLVLVAIDLPRLDGLLACKAIREALPSTKVVVVTRHKTPKLCAAAMSNGASAFITKESTGEELLIALRAVLRGGSYITPLITRETVELMMLQPKSYDEARTVTEREKEVLGLIAQGYTMKEIASELNVQAGTVAFHKYKVMRTLGLRTNAELVRYAIETGRREGVVESR